jgi:hypothetical protein
MIEVKLQGRRRTQSIQTDMLDVGRHAHGWNRFLANFETANITDECVVWPFSTNGGTGGRYPQIGIDGKTVGVTRYVFERITGKPLATREVIRHSCDQPRCVNPWHFEVGSQADNMRDMVERKRSAAGERNGSARLTAAEVREIRQLATDHSLRYGDVSFIARGYGVSPRTVMLILTGETWKGVRIDSQPV